MIFVKIEISDNIKPGWVPWQQRGNYFLTRLPPRPESSRRTSHEKAKMLVLDNWCHDDDDDGDFENKVFEEDTPWVLYVGTVVSNEMRMNKDNIRKRCEKDEQRWY